MPEKHTMPQTHDYRDNTRTWGHDYVFRPLDSGQRGQIYGFGQGIVSGDFLLFSHPKGGEARYRVDTITHKFNPPDMWEAEVSFAPRQEAT